MNKIAKFDSKESLLASIAKTNVPTNFKDLALSGTIEVISVDTITSSKAPEFLQNEQTIKFVLVDVDGTKSADTYSIPAAQAANIGKDIPGVVAAADGGAVEININGLQFDSEAGSYAFKLRPATTQQQTSSVL